MTNKQKTTTFLAFVATFAIGISYTYASWTGPTATPPNANTSAPLNISSVTQYKAGPLGVGGYFETFSGMNMNGKNINGVAAPIAGTDAVNKDYVDALSGEGAGGGTPCGSYLTTDNNTPYKGINTETATGCVVPNLSGGTIPKSWFQGHCLYGDAIGDSLSNAEVGYRAHVYYCYNSI